MVSACAEVQHHGRPRAGVGGGTLTLSYPMPVSHLQELCRVCPHACSSLADAGPRSLVVQPHTELADLCLLGYFSSITSFLLSFTVFLSLTQQ